MKIPDRYKIPKKYIPLLTELRQMYENAGYKLLYPLDVMTGWCPRNDETTEFQLTFYGEHLQNFYAPDGFCEVLGSTVCDTSLMARVNMLQALKDRFHLKLIKQNEDYSVYSIPSEVIKQCKSLPALA